MTELQLLPEVEHRGGKFEGIARNGDLLAVIDRDAEGMVVMATRGFGEAWAVGLDGSLAPASLNTRIEAKRHGGKPSPMMQPLVAFAISHDA